MDARTIEDLARVECLNTGKPISQARDDVRKTADACEFYGGLADKLFGSTIPSSPELFNYTSREPVGVTAHIAPWNYPLRLAFRSVIPALAAGNTVVLKPATQTPLSALCMAGLLADAGIPPGVFNVVCGSGSEVGTALASHPGINHLAFTGSYEAGVSVMKLAANNVVPVTLELGGKSPNLIFADADLDRAVDVVIKAMFTNAGQLCFAATRLLVEESIANSFVARCVERAERLRVGPGIEDPDMGPLISAAHRDRVMEYIQIGQQEGGRLLTGGTIPSTPACQGGYFLNPTVIDGTPPSSRVCQEEIFGPVLTVLRFSSTAEAIRLANDTEFGLAAGIWTNRLDRAHQVAAAIKAGQIFINDYFSGSAASPFGGYKRSGFGRERGVEVMNHYTQVKNVCIRFHA